MYNIDWNIEFTTDKKKYKLGLVAEAEVVASVDNLVDTAVIVLPETVINDPLRLENKIKRGSEVLIQFGYDGDLKTEFKGWVREVISNDSSLKIYCEDDIFLFRKSVRDAELKSASLQKVLQYVVDQIDPEFEINCTYEVNYEKFTIYNATGYDVLKKLQEETNFNIDFNRKEKKLNIYPPYIESEGKVFYSMQKNISGSSLEFKNKDDFNLEVTVESTDVSGKVTKIERGTTGGDKVSIKVGSMDKPSMEKIAEAALTRRAKPSYEGTFEAWLIPFVKPAMSAQIKDEDYPDKTAFYYVASVRTAISSNGGTRTITPTLKLT
jgi:hypothetical protein